MRVPVSELGPATKPKEAGKFPGADKKQARLEKDSMILTIRD